MGVVLKADNDDNSCACHLVKIVIMLNGDDGNDPLMTMMIVNVESSAPWKFYHLPESHLVTWLWLFPPAKTTVAPSGIAQVSDPEILSEKFPPPTKYLLQTCFWFTWNNLRGASGASASAQQHNWARMGGRRPGRVSSSRLTVILFYRMWPWSILLECTSCCRVESSWCCLRPKKCTSREQNQPHFLHQCHQCFPHRRPASPQTEGRGCGPPLVEAGQE